MTQRDALNTKNYTLTHQKTIFNIEIFWSELWVKKNFFKIGKYNWKKIQNTT